GRRHRRLRAGVRCPVVLGVPQARHRLTTAPGRQRRTGCRPVRAGRRGAREGNPPRTCIMAAMEWITSPEAWIALVTLTVLEIVLGIDNIIFISILSGRLPAHQQQRARTLGLALAMFTRIALLASISWIARLTTVLFEVIGHGVTGRDLVFLLGGLFLIWKATQEIHERLEGQAHAEKAPVAASFSSVITQIV